VQTRVLRYLFWTIRCRTKYQNLDSFDTL